MTNDIYTATPSSGPLGSKLDSHYRREVSIIGAIDLSATGNTVLRVGKLEKGQESWVQTEHIVLTPSERERFIAILLGHRGEEPAVRRLCEPQETTP